MIDPHSFSSNCGRVSNTLVVDTHLRFAPIDAREELQLFSVALLAFVSLSRGIGDCINRCGCPTGTPWTHSLDPYPPVWLESCKQRGRDRICRAVIGHGLTLDVSKSLRSKLERLGYPKTTTHVPRRTNAPPLLAHGPLPLPMLLDLRAGEILRAVAQAPKLLLRAATRGQSSVFREAHTCLSFNASATWSLRTPEATALANHGRGFHKNVIVSQTPWSWAEPDEYQNVSKLLECESVSASEMAATATTDPDQHRGRTEYSWICTDCNGNQNEVRGLGSAWTCNDIFRDNSKYLPKDPQEAKNRERSLKNTMFNDLAQAFGGENENSL